MGRAGRCGQAGVSSRGLLPAPQGAAADQLHLRLDQRVKQKVAQAWSALVPVPPARIPERAKEQAR
jgi:hypothetical protein